MIACPKCGAALGERTITVARCGVATELYCQNGHVQVLRVAPRDPGFVERPDDNVIMTPETKEKLKAARRTRETRVRRTIGGTCVRGHAMTPENSYLVRGKTSYVCRTCKNQSNARYRAQLKTA